MTSTDPTVGAPALFVNPGSTWEYEAVADADPWAWSPEGTVQIAIGED